MKIIIIGSYKNIDFEKEKFTIGGVQTYLKDLALAFAEAGYESNIYSFDPTVKETSNFVIEGVSIKRYPSFSKNGKPNFQKTFNKLYKLKNSTDTIFIIGTDQLNIRSKGKNVIAIQHGIAFDIPGEDLPGFCRKHKNLQLLNKLGRCLSNVERFGHTQNVVCVDYNFVNWYRTIGTINPEKNVSVIPNYSSQRISEKEFSEKLETRTNPLKIVFARRGVGHRGIFIFSDVIDKLFEEGYDIDVTFATNETNEVKKTRIHFKDNPRVHFTNYASKDSVSFHKNFDIAVIPTIYSEGTSLSLNEAMAAGCLPVCTFVGGMSNMIIDEYNGYMCYPSFEELLYSLKQALNLSNEKFNLITRNAYQTAINAFDIDTWKRKWIRYIERIEKINKSQ